MNLLVGHATQADGINSDAPLLRAHVGVQMKLCGGMPIDVTIEAGDSETRVSGLPVVGRIELLLWERREEQSQAVQLHWRQKVLEESVIVVDRHDLAA